MLESWLVSDDETKRRHATYRLNVTEDPETFTYPANFPTTIPDPSPVESRDPWLPLIRACPDYNPGCCASVALLLAVPQGRVPRRLYLVSRRAGGETLNPAVNSLTAPGQRRPGIMLGGILQIMVGRGCDKSCFGCTQGSNLSGKAPWMSVDHFDEACQSLDGYFGVIGLFGGNACLHPRFDDLCRIMQSHFPRAQRGIWTNNLNGHGAVCRQTFDPAHSNLNVHLDSEAADEIRRDWPEATRFIKGDQLDSLHGTPWVSPTDLGVPEEDRWQLDRRLRHLEALVGDHHGDPG